MSSLILLKPATNLLLYSFTFGGAAFYSFVASPIAFKVLQKDQFSTLQHNVFPLFFKMQSIAPLLLTATAPFNLTAGPITALTVASVTGLMNLFWLLPWNQRLKLERRKLAEKLKGEENAKALEEQDAPLQREFGKAHGLSMLVNVGHIASLLVYGVFLTKGLFFLVP